MDSNSWEIVETDAASQNGETASDFEIGEEHEDDKEFHRQSSRYGQNVKNYE